MSGTFLEFAKLCDALAATTKKLEKRSLMAEWLKTLTVEDAARGSLYLAGQAFAETDGRVLNLGAAILSNALARLSGANDVALHAAYRKHGDLGAAAEDLLRPNTAKEPLLTLAGVEERLGRIAAAKGAAAKLPVTLELLARATPLEAKYLIKLALGDMRTGVKQSLVEEAVAAAYIVEAAEVRRATMLMGNLPGVVRLAAAGRLEEARMSLFHPLGFMLASPVDSVEEALGRFAQEVAAEVRDPTGGVQEAEIAKAQIEDKYDGIRVQLHCGDPEQPGRVALFSRSREEITAAFPELVEAFARVDAALILDGEVLAWDFAKGRAKPFSSLQTRIGRKKVTDEMREQIPAVFVAFDILYRHEELLLERPLSERRAVLEAFAAENAPMLTSAFRASKTDARQASLFTAEQAGVARLALAPVTELSNADQLDRAYTDARARGNEGVMIKSRGSLYQPGRRGLAWLKLKRELATLDVVVTAAEFGHGRRAGILSDYTFAVRDGEKHKNVGKAYSGLTDAEIAELSQFFMAHTIEDSGYVRSVEPILVLEVAFNNVMRSERHESGFALRFPRILRIRHDKPVEEIDTLARVKEIYASQPELAATE